MRYVGLELNKLVLVINFLSFRIIFVFDLLGLEVSLFLDVEIYEGYEDLLNLLDVIEDGLWIVIVFKDNTVIVWRYNENSCKFDIYVKYIGYLVVVIVVGLLNIVLKGYFEFLLIVSNDLIIKKWIILKLIVSMDV